MSDYLTFICLDCPYENQGSPFRGETINRRVLQELLNLREEISEIAVIFERMMAKLSAPRWNCPHDIHFSFIRINSYVEHLHPKWWAQHQNHRIEIVPVQQFADHWLKRKEQNE